MNIKKGIFFLALVLVLSAIAACGGGSDPAPPPPGTLRLYNESGFAIGAFYLIPASDPTWGPNQLSDPLLTGSSIDFVDMPPDTYEAMAVVNGEFSTYYGYLNSIPITSGAIYEVTALSSSFTGSLEIVNGTVGANIIGLYVVPAGSGLGPNQITSSIGPGGSYHMTDMPPGSYDVLVDWDVGADSLYSSQSITSLSLLTLNVI